MPNTRPLINKPFNIVLFAKQVSLMAVVIAHLIITEYSTLKEYYRLAEFPFTAFVTIFILLLVYLLTFPLIYYIMKWGKIDKYKDMIIIIHPLIICVVSGIFLGELYARVLGETIGYNSLILLLIFPIRAIITRTHKFFVIENVSLALFIGAIIRIIGMIA